MVKRPMQVGDIVGFKQPDDVQAEATGLLYQLEGDRAVVIPLTAQAGEHSIELQKDDTTSFFELKGRFLDWHELVQLAASDLSILVTVKKDRLDEIIRFIVSYHVGRHYELVHKQELFRPGESYINYGGRKYDEREMIGLMDAALDFWLTAGRNAAELEERFAATVGLKHCLLTNSGSSANLLAIACLTSPKLGKRRLVPGDEVITTACGFPTTVAPIVQNQLIPVLVDVDLRTYNADLASIRKAISPRTKAIFLAHTLGNPFEADAVQKIAREHDLWLIEDTCDALGSLYNGQQVGTFGDISTFSFYPAHHITTGEGGAVLTNSSKLERLIRSFRDWGRDCWCASGKDNSCQGRFSRQHGRLPFGYDHKYVYSHLGYNLKMTDLQAAIGLVQLDKLDSFNQARRANWQTLRDGLADLDKWFVLPEATVGSDPSWFGFVLTLRCGVKFDRSDIVKYLEDQKIATRMLFAGNIIYQPCFEGVEHRCVDELTNTDKIMNDTFWLGVYPGMTPAKLGYMIDRVHEFCRSRN